MMHGVVSVLFLIAFTCGVMAAEVIGLSLPLDGRFAPIAKRMEFGAQLAVQQLTEAGRNIEIVLADDACDENRAPEIARSFIDAQVEVVIGPVCFKFAVALAARMKAEREQGNPVPVVMSHTRNLLLQRLRDVEELPLASLSNGPKSEAQAIVDLIFPRFQDKPFAIVDDGSVYGRALSDDLRLLGEQSGYQAVASTNFRPLQKNQLSMLRRLRSSGVEAIVIAAAAEDVATIANDVRTLGLDWIVATGERGRLLPFTADLDSNLAGILMVEERQLTTDEARAEIDSVEDEDLEDSLLLGYVLVELGAEMARRGLHDPAGHSFKTVIGDLTFDASGRASPAPFVLLQWQDGVFEPVKAN